MPRTSLCEDRERRRDDYVAGMIKGAMRQHQRTPADMERSTGMDARKVGRKLQHPMDAKLSEVYAICDAAGVSISWAFRDVPE